MWVFYLKNVLSNIPYFTDDVTWFVRLINALFNFSLIIFGFQLYGKF